MRENDLKQLIFINKEIEVLSKELLQLNSDQLIQEQGFTEKLYLGAIIEKTACVLSDEISKVEAQIKLKLHELFSKRVDIENYLNSIEDCEIRLILRLRYVSCMSYAEIASELTVVNEYGDVLRSVTGDGLSLKISRFFKKH